MRDDEHGTNTTRLTCPNVVRQARDVTRVTHEDCCSDFSLSSCGNGNGCVEDAFVSIASATVCIIKDLTTLRGTRISNQSFKNTGLLIPGSIQLEQARYWGTAG